MEQQNTADGTPTKYTLSRAETSALGEANRQITAIKSTMLDLSEQLKTAQAMKNGVLQLIAFQQGLAGNWQLSPDGTELVRG